MRPLRYSINVTLDGCCDHRQIVPDGELYRHIVEYLAQADALQEPGTGLYVGGVTLPQALAELGLIDEYEFVVHPRLVGHGPTLLSGLSKHIDLKLVSRTPFGSGAVAMRYEPRK